MLRKYFKVNVNRYVKDKNFFLYRPASLNYPKDQAVMFVTERYMKFSAALEKCKDCLVFWPQNIDIPNILQERHALYPCNDPRTEYCRFFKDNEIIYYPKIDSYKLENGAFIANTAEIGRNCTIFPGAYIGGEVSIGENVYIGTGVKLIGEIRIGNNVIIRENSVIGADGLSTVRDADGMAITMPQFGGVVIEDNVQIGALTVIGRGAIDDTVIQSGSKIDNSCFISHNVQVGKDTFIVGESILFGSSSTGPRVYIGGNSCIRDGVSVGKETLIGMGSVVVKDIPDGVIVKGNPAT